jgi:predicted phosphodiesterase
MASDAPPRVIHPGGPIVTTRTVHTLLLLGLAAASISSAGEVETASTGLRLLAGPYLQSPGETSMTVMWMTDRNANGWLEYGVDEPLTQKAVASEDGLREANTRLHRVTLSGLQPGTTYHYRVVVQEVADFQPYKMVLGQTLRGEPQSFRTLDRGRRDCAFVVLNDNHEQTLLLRARLARAAARPYDLVFYNGDMLDHADDEAQIVDRVLGPSTDLFARSIPMIWVRGNHETRGAYARQLKSYVASPNGHYYYSFDHGPVHFIVMDSGEDKPDDHREYSGLVDFDAYREAETEWLKGEVESAAFKAAPFRVVLMHQPPFVLERPAEQNHGREHGRQQWEGLLNRGVDLLLAAHTHRFQIVEPELGIHDYPIVVGGGPKEGQGTVVRVEADRDRLEVSVTGDDGASLGTKIVRRRP